MVYVVGVRIGSFVGLGIGSGGGEESEDFESIGSSSGSSSAPEGPSSSIFGSLWVGSGEGGSESEGVVVHSDIVGSFEVDPLTAILVFGSSNPLILFVNVSAS